MNQINKLYSVFLNGILIFLLIFFSFLTSQDVKGQGGPNQPFFDLPDDYCADYGNLNLFDYTANFVTSAGTFTGPGVIGSTFVPNPAFPSVTITYVDATGVVYTDLMQVHYDCCPVTPSTVILELPAKWCFYEGLLDLTAFVSVQGGTFSGNGVTGNFFDPQAIIPPYTQPVFTIQYSLFNATDNCYDYVHGVIYVDNLCCYDIGSPYVVPSYGGSATGLGLTNFTNTDVTILGDFYLDANFNINNSLIRFDDHVTMTVQSGKTLTITGASDLFSCKQIAWQGIKLEPGAIINVDGNSYIQDAETAIYAEDDAIVNLINCTFNKNVVGVHLKYGLNQLTPYPFFLNGNVTFSNVSSVNSPGTLMDDNVALFNRSYIGIKAEETNILNIGNNSIQPNYFDNIDIGIYAHNTSINVYNNSFAGISGFELPLFNFPRYIAIYAFNDKTSLQANIGILKNGFFTNGSNVFEDCNIGMSLTNFEKIDIKNNFLDAPTVDLVPGSPFLFNGLWGIFTQNDFVPPTYVNQIASNTIKGFNESIRVTSIGFNILNTTTLNIENNTIEQMYRPLNNGIILSSVIPSSLAGINNNWQIFNNVIKDCFNGITVSNIRATELVIELNNIKMKASPGVSIKIGIRLQNCYKTSVINNTVKGAYGFAASTKYKGIFSSFSISTKVACNTINTMGQSMIFEGPSYGTVAANKMQRAYDGFVLLNNGEIGQQGDPLNPSDNKWIGPFFNSQTLTNNTSTANTNSKIFLRPLGNFLPTGNEFVNGTPLDVYQFGTGLNSAIGPMISCPALPRDIKVMEELAKGNQGYLIFEPSTKWIGKHTVYNELLNDSTLLLQSSILDSFYFASQNGCFDKVTKIIDAATQLDTSLLGTLTSNFNPNCDIELNYKDFYTIMYNYWVNGNVSTTEFVSIENIALQCPILGGTVVYSARDFYNYLTYTNTEFEDNCEEFVSREMLDSLNTENIEFNIYPNPNNGEFNLTVNQVGGKITIFELSGKILFLETILNSEVKIDIPDIIPGLYIIEFSNDNVIARRKFVVE